MTTTTARPGIRHRAGAWWLGLSALAIAVYAPLPYLTTSLSELAANGGGLADNYVDRPAALQGVLYLHIVGSALALLLSPWQLSARVRRRIPRLHRVGGRLTLAGIAVGGTAGLVLSPFNAAGPVGTAGFGLLAVVWLGCAAAALRAILRGDVASHRRWAIRTFALTYAGVTLRLWLAVFIVGSGLDEQTAFDRFYPLTAFLSWVPNLLLAEWLLRRKRITART